MSARLLTDEQVEEFVQDGFVKVEGAFPKDLAAEACGLLWEQLGMDPDDPATWTREVVRLGLQDAEPFVRSANTPELHAAFDQLVGPGRWMPIEKVGTFPVRFPRTKPPEEAEDYGWHIDASFLTAEAEAANALNWEGELALVPPNYDEILRCNVTSRGRSLLLLLLYTDTGERDAPTLLRVGSHLDVPPLLAPYGPEGTYLEAAGVGVERPLASATGEAGDAYLCHPFLVHTPISNTGLRPRFMAQPSLLPVGELDLDRADGGCSPVERAIRLGLGREEES
ncbi:phytanoyl-CoA dioxygenase [Spongiactinospora sp. TRM90649]|uniref:phytanoyl-CoA dioxygenase n=1 Tax=Spongiactinospora sp. TRM90649 TaxID=3031114 RepID=UPI0023F8D345|nr:phytanoyl-CoA dioxygenase [Spongiactinospora sp. TRM90649]MDF5753511.1 phytanoyl-CoA dioxygenase [Spongiactinospora sp. TRM90649]